MRRIYLDNNAATPLLPAVLEAMLPYFTTQFGNPASSHRHGRLAQRTVEDAREQIAGLLHADADEVIFTSGATEANNLALFGLTSASGHIVTSPIEHPCVAEPIQRLAEHGFAVDYLPVDRTGIVRLSAASFSHETRLVSVMLANHETGARQPIEEIVGQVANLPNRPTVHTDAAAAVGKIPVSFHGLGVDALSVSAHKFHGPQGIGALLLRRSARLQPLFLGGHQQKGRRPGTEPVALIVGFAKALEIAVDFLESNHVKILQSRQRFLSLLQEKAGPVIVNGPAEGGAPSTLNLSFPGCQGDAMLMALDLAGVSCSTGSACSSGSLLPSPVLKAMGLEKELLHSALRFSLSPQLTEEDLDDAVRCISHVVNRLRHENSAYADDGRRQE